MSRILKFDKSQIKYAHMPEERMNFRQTYPKPIFNEY